MGLVALLIASTVCAGEGQPIHLVVPYSPGGATDIVARAFGQKLSEELGQPVIVENKPGANGNVAAASVAGSVPDGKTLLVGGNALILGPLLFSSLKLDALRDFTPIGNMVRVPLVLISGPAFAARDGRGFIELAKSSGEALTYASPSPGIMMSTEQLKSLAGIEMLRVPYRGPMEGSIDVMAGRVSVMFDSIGAQLPNIRAGRVRALAVNSPTRHPMLPEVPTLAESGVAGFEEDNYVGLLGPAGMRRDLVERYNMAIERILKAPDFKAVLNRHAFIAAPASSAAYSQMLAETARRFSQVTRRLGIRPE
jgi:tripartite-type tricarboxylate transporter receptor subunit TctC